MKNVSKFASIGLAAFGLFMTSAATADFQASPIPEGSIESCVTEIGGHADYSDAARVRHVLEDKGWRSLARKLRIKTKVYGEGDSELIREDTTKCIVYGDDKPVFFKIEEVKSGA